MSLPAPATTACNHAGPTDMHRGSHRFGSGCLLPAAAIFPLGIVLAMIHWHHVRHAQLSQAIDKMHPHVKSADGTEAVSSDLIQEDSIGRRSCISIGPESLPFVMDLRMHMLCFSKICGAWWHRRCQACSIAKAIASSSGRTKESDPLRYMSAEKPGRSNPSIWIMTGGGCILANSHSGMAEHGLNTIMDIVSVRSFVICSSQREYFAVDDIELCC